MNDVSVQLLALLQFIPPPPAAKGSLAGEREMPTPTLNEADHKRKI